MLADHAILTGDLIGSTRHGAGATEAAMATLMSEARSISLWPGIHDCRFTRFRGDGWQIALPDPALALRAALVLQAALRHRAPMLGTRLSIGIGPVESLGGHDLSDGAGPAFVASGQGLDQMKPGMTLVLAGAAIGPRDQAIVALLAELTRRWSGPQAEAMAQALHPSAPRLEPIARTLGITVQSVSYRLRGGGLSAIRSALQNWELAMTESRRG